MAPSSAFSQIFPLILTLVVVGSIGFVVYHIYLAALQFRDHTAQRMERKNLAFSKDGGLRVSVKDVGDETYLDRTQSWFVKAWELGEEEVNANKKRKKTGTFRKAA
ncbi:hypothetical protein SMACR_03494 [Sordaria macrospora]|uniref:WGS project CABT00000000 data, contig 2.9 n=2 Tax=Sordaria macrospora TaxID=5147 RepID=F7VVC3_SORMK|nr:uncharacterized protein SMAC_03494 [Sordaria macrospora k-hell]KAA8629224.1 hypothetical protein SMACR_03494 [Sordaria macrospora]KAH7625916.1 hypothetical protein B0T09DRAFT_387569 [Sordaria sp. MPI-SDFR-AT-0083]WPJ65891.1 hypothetical protein SMAC4_03494 [Sordaria macrospora]CCC09464.1 unnamed protein product [Sordaria macrospora k-hell]